MKHVAKRAKLDADAAKAKAAEAARAGRREVAVALANKKVVKPKRCMCQMEWCQTQNTVDSYSHALKSRELPERLSWLTVLRPGTDVAYRKKLAATPGNLRAHTSNFHYYHKFWTAGEQQTLRLRDEATCHAGRVHRTPMHPRETLEENTYERPLGQGGPRATGARGGAGGAGAGAGGARRGGAAAAAQLTVYQCNSLLPEYEQNRNERIMVGSCGKAVGGLWAGCEGVWGVVGGFVYGHVRVCVTMRDCADAGAVCLYTSYTHHGPTLRRWRPYWAAAVAAAAVYTK